MKAADIGLNFGDTVSSSNWASFEFVDGVPEALWFGTVQTSLGAITVVGTGDDICYLGFEEKKSIELCRKSFPKADISVDQNAAQKMVDKIMTIWNGTSSETIRMIVNATNFQKEVWNILMRIPHGHAISYGVIAEHMGKPKASRAVGTAVGSNPVSLFIPCHRVIQKSGKIENYLWGSEVKQRILMAEAANQTSKNPASRKSR